MREVIELDVAVREIEQRADEWRAAGLDVVVGDPLHSNDSLLALARSLPFACEVRRR